MALLDECTIGALLCLEKSGSSQFELNKGVRMSSRACARECLSVGCCCEMPNVNETKRRGNVERPSDAGSYAFPPTICRSARLAVSLHGDPSPLALPHADDTYVAGALFWLSL